MLVDKELAHRGLSELRIVGSMHDRKALMAELAGAFLALPGGLGTLEELCEILTWCQLGIHTKPCGCLNVLGYFDSLLQQLDHAARERFLHPEQRRLLLSEAEPQELLTRLQEHQPAPDARWFDRDAT
jgi:uncharacterized protein (TIGR00730 family)